jgi:hypothetical protein
MIVVEFLDCDESRMGSPFQVRKAPFDCGFAAFYRKDSKRKNRE